MGKRGKKANYIQNSRNAARLKQQRDEYIQRLASIDRIADALESTKTQEQTDDDQRAFREIVTIWLLIFTVIFTGGADVIFYLTLEDSHYNAAEQIGRLDQQLGLMRSASTQTDAQIAVTKDLASAARDQAGAARDNIVAEKEDTENSSRAWVGPTGAVIDAAPSTGKPLTATVTYANSGKQPGTDMASYVEEQSFYASDIIDEANFINNSVIKCNGIQTIAGGQVAYPTTGFAAYTLFATINGDVIDQATADGSRIIVLTGCFAYNTFNELHHSSFCFFYRKGVTRELNLSFCAGGNNAN